MKVLWFALVHAAIVASHSHGQTCGQWLGGYPMPGVTEGGTVRASIAWDPDGAGPLGTHLVVGGEFTAIGNAVASNIAMWNPATDQWSALGSGTNDDVLALAVMPDNTLIAGGTFTACGTTTTSRIASWNGTAWSSLSDAPGSEGVRTLAGASYVAALLRMNDGRLLVGGNFELAGADVHRRVVIWDGTTWTRVLADMGGTALLGNEFVTSFALLPSGSVAIGGSFNNFGVLLAVNNICLYFPETDHAIALGNGFNGPVNALAARNNGNILAGGQFSASGATPMANLARWTGSAWTAMGSGTNGTVNSIHINPTNGSEVYVGGSFSVAGSVACRSIVRTNGTGGSYTDLAGGLHNDLYALGLGPRVHTILQFAPGVLFAGGNFSSSNQAQLRSIAKWNGAAWSAIANGLGAPVRAIDVDPSGGVLLGGYFANTPSGPAKRIASWSPSGFVAMGQGTDDAVFAVKRLHNNDVVAAGNFDDAGGTFASSVARYNGSTWAPVGPGFPIAPNYPFKSIAQLPVGAPNLGAGDLYVGGEIGSVLPVTTPIGLNVASFNGTSWTALDGPWISFLDPVGDGFVAAVLSLPDGNLVLAGNFDNVSGFPISACVARWKPGTFAVESMGNAFSSADHRIYCLARLPSGDIVAGGDFSIADGGPGNAVARWNGSSWLPLGSGLTGTVYALTVAANGDLIAGGTLTQAGSTPVNNIARWNGTTWSAMGDGVRNTVYALATRPNGEILVGGNFARAGGNVSAYFARWSDSAVAQILQQPLSDAVTCFESPEFTVTVDPGTSPTYQWYFNGSPISNGGKYEITALPNGSRLRFNLLYFYDTDAGDYHVVATTPCGSVSSAVATLTITGDCPPPCPADLNGDTLVDDADFVLFAEAYNQLICSPPEEEQCAGDLNGDLLVDDADFVLFAEAYNQLICP